MNTELKNLKYPMATDITVCDTTGYLEHVYVSIDPIWIKVDADNKKYVSFSANLYINKSPQKHILIEELEVNESFNEFNKFYNTLNKLMSYEVTQKRVEGHDGVDFGNELMRSANRMTSHMNRAFLNKLKNINMLRPRLNMSRDTHYV